MTDTRAAAYSAAKKRAPGVKDHVLRLLCVKACTADELAGVLGLSVLTVRPAVCKLGKEGKIEDTGLRRKNASGKDAIVWRTLEIPKVALP